MRELDGKKDHNPNYSKRGGRLGHREKIRQCKVQMCSSKCPVLAEAKRVLFTPFPSSFSCNLHPDRVTQNMETTKCRSPRWPSFCPGTNTHIEVLPLGFNLLKNPKESISTSKPPGSPRSCPTGQRAGAAQGRLGARHHPTPTMCVKEAQLC